MPTVIELLIGYICVIMIVKIIKNILRFNNTCKLLNVSTILLCIKIESAQVLKMSILDNPSISILYL